MAALSDRPALRVSLVPSLAGTELPPLVVEPDADGAVLHWLDAERAVLEVRGGSEGRGGSKGRRRERAAVRERLLLLPSVPAPEAGITRREVIVGGWRVEVDIEPAARAVLRERAGRGRQDVGHSGPTELHAIIPGVVVGVSVAAGDDVAAGQQLLTIEAMKMQNELRAPRTGTITRVAVAPGQTIDVGDLLLVIT